MRHSGVDDALNAWMLQHSRHDAVQLWFGGGPWEVEQWTGKLWRCQITKCACLSHVLVTRETDRQTATLARPTNWQLSRCGWTSGPPRPAPLTHWELITVQWTYSSHRLLNHAQAASRWLRVSTVVKRSSIVGPVVYHTSRQREIQCSIPRNFFEFRESR